jgi:hypothetical protein
MANC